MMMFFRSCAIVMALAVSVVDGFSPHQPSLPVTTAGTPLAASSSAFSRPQTSSSRSPWTSLYMSDSSSSSDVSSKESSSTKLNAATGEMAEALESTPASNLGELLAAKARQIDWDEVVNTSFVVLVSVAVLYKLTSVDAGMTRGWTVEEVAARTVSDNWSHYTQVLRDSPIATKAATSATVYTIGDVIAQRTGGVGMGSLDRPRILRSMLAGLIGHGPMSHFWYEFSEDFFDNVLQLTQWWSFIPKVVIDQSFWGPIWNNTYILLLGLMKLESLESIWGDVKRTTIPLVVSGLKLWPLAHCITYGLVPVENRLLWVDMVEVVWVTILATQAAGGPSAEGAEEAEPVTSKNSKTVCHRRDK